MNWLEKLFELSGSDFLIEWKKSWNFCAKIQSEVLQDILQTSQGSEMGQKYNFSALNDIESFREKVPLSSWTDYELSAGRMENGAEDVLFSGKTKYFLKTSGTTGSGKNIPESELGAKAKQLVVRARQYSILNYFAAKIKGKITGHTLAMSSSPVYGVTKAGIPLGFASGITRCFSDPSLKDLAAYPPVITSLSKPEAVNYLIMRFALCHSDIISVSGNNAGRLSALINYAQENAWEIIDDIAKGTISARIDVPDDLKKELLAKLQPLPQRAEELQEILSHGKEFFIPQNYWPDLQTGVFWLSGTVGKYLDDVTALLPKNVIYFDLGYGASEAKINIPYMPGTASGILSSCTAFYEFIPQDGSSLKLAHELEIGQSYELVLTTYSGLYRYLLGDIVQVTDFSGDTPELVFLYKKGEIGNIAEEKIPASLLLDLNTEYLKARGRELVCCQLLADEDSRCYHVFLEINEGDSIELKAADLDEYWRQNSLAYDFVRSQGYLQPLTITLMKNGWREHLYSKRAGVPVSQIKLPILVKERPEWRIN